jgi:hypothetical protein
MQSISDNRAILEWLIDALPAGFEWVGVPIVALSFLLMLFALAAIGRIAWTALADLMHDESHDHRS